MSWPLLNLPADPALRLLALASLVVALCVVAVLAAVARNFLLAQHADAVQRERRSPIETGTMLAFFVGFYLLVTRRVGMLPFPDYPIHLAVTGLGLLLLVGGTVVNILGRFSLGRNWANQVTIYETQTLVTTGVYGLVRHPLYASLIWMFYGASLIYLNWAAALATTLVFVPAMVVRAQQEELLLAERFPAYAEYQRQVGRLIPRLWRTPHVHQ